MSSGLNRAHVRLPDSATVAQRFFHCRVRQVEPARRKRISSPLLAMLRYYVSLLRTMLVCALAGLARRLPDVISEIASTLDALAGTLRVMKARGRSVDAMSLVRRSAAA